MEIKIQKLKNNNTTSNLKKNKFHPEQKSYISKNSNISNTNINITINKNVINSKIIKLAHQNNIFSNEKEKSSKIKIQMNDLKNNNKLILGMDAEKSKEKVRQDSYNGLIKTEETHLDKKNIAINKRSFLGKVNNFSIFNSKSKKDICINNENINNNIPKNKNEPLIVENHNQKNQITALIKVTEKNKKFKRTFSGYGVRRKSSMNKKNTPNNKYYNYMHNKKLKSNNSHNKKKEQITIYNNSIQNNKNINMNNENSNNYKTSISKSAKKYKINEYANNKESKIDEIKKSSTHILNYKDKTPITNISFQNKNETNNNNNDKILNKSGNNFYEKKIKEKLFDGNISYSGTSNNIIDNNKDIKKTNSIISINLKYIDPHHTPNTNTKQIIHKKNNSISSNNIINIKVKMTNRMLPANSIRDKHVFVEQISQEPTITTKNLVKKDINLTMNKQNIFKNNNENISKQKNSNKNKSNSNSKLSNNKAKNIKNITESKSQNKTTKINLEKHFINNDNTNMNNNLKRFNHNTTYKHSSEKISITKIKEQEKSKGKEKELNKNKKQSTLLNTNFSTITHRANNNIKGNSLANIKPNKTTNTNVIKYPNIDYIKKRFIEGPLTINELEEKSEDIISKECSFVINIISNWGNKKKVGITEIEIFDTNNRKIKINNIIIKSSEGNTNYDNANKLFNNKIHTINENDMWIMDINKKNIYSQFLNIFLYIYANIDNKKSILENINYIIIWNYNGWEINRGVKKIEIIKDEYIYFSGIIPRGDHTLLQEHYYKIKLKKKFFIKRNQNQKGSALNMINNNKNNNSIKIEKYKHQRERSFDCNFISCNMSVSNKNFQYNQVIRKKENDDSDKKRSYLSFLKSSSNKKAKISFPTIVSTFKNHFSSSRSYKKDKKNNSFVNLGYVKKYNILLNYRRNNNKNLKSSRSANNIKNYINKNMSINTDNNGAVKNILIKSKIYSMKNQSYDNKKRYSNNTYEASNKFLTNIKSITFNNNITKNIYNSLRCEESIKKDSQFLPNTLRVTSFNNISQNNIPYITFKKIRINILSNYGNQLSVGLTGINLIDNNLQKINIESACAIGALPKDLRTVFDNENDFRIFENLFNGDNNTIDENNMWLTLISHQPYIEICFEDYINLSKIEIWNFNQPMNLDNCVKEIEIIFDDEGMEVRDENEEYELISDENLRKYNIILWKGLGIDYFNYYQTIKCDERYLKKLSNKYKKLKDNIDSIKLPIGFIFKIVFISNYGDEKAISLKKLELFNENDEKLNKYNVIDDTNYKINLRNESTNDLLIEDYFYFHDFYDFRKNKDSLCKNNLYICFEEIVQIKCIKLYNTDNEKIKNTSTKDIQIYCDDILFCEKRLNQLGENIINFENGNCNDILNNFTEEQDEINAKKNYNAYKEILNDGIYRLVL